NPSLHPLSQCIQPRAQPLNTLLSDKIWPPDHHKITRGLGLACHYPGSVNHGHDRITRLRMILNKTNFSHLRPHQCEPTTPTMTVRYNPQNTPRPNHPTPRHMSPHTLSPLTFPFLPPFLLPVRWGKSFRLSRLCLSPRTSNEFEVASGPPPTLIRHTPPTSAPPHNPPLPMVFP
ncbi:hypothetical protein J6590_106372, partial [Homalodisca vitripennis]